MQFKYSHTNRVHRHPPQIRTGEDQPILFPNPIAREIYQYIYLPLADYDPHTIELVPLLINDIPKAERVGEGVKYTFEIRSDAVWDDGEPITGHDYLFTLKAALVPESGAKAYASVLGLISNVEIDPKNEKKVTVSFVKKSLLSLETAINFEILPKHIFDPEGLLDSFMFADILNGNRYAELSATNKNGISFGTLFNSIKYSREIISGAGPYRFDHWSSGTEIVLVRKDNYWGSAYEYDAFKSIPASITFKIIPDDNNAVSQLMSDGIDLIPGLDAKLFQQLQQDSSNTLQFLSPELTKYYYFILNNSRPGLNEVAVRQALASLSEVEQYISLFESGLGTPLRSFVSPGKFGENKDLNPIPFDPENAKKLLDENGWIDSNSNGIRDKMVEGKRVELDFRLYTSGALSKDIALLFADRCKDAGIQIEIIQKEFSLIRLENLRTGDFDIIPSLASLDLNMDDPRDRFHSVNAGPGGNNYANFINPEADSLIDVVRNTSKDKERMDAYFKLQTLVHSLQPYIYLYAPKEKIVLNSKWEGWGTLKRPGYMANAFEYAGPQIQ